MRPRQQRSFSTREFTNLRLSNQCIERSFRLMKSFAPYPPRRMETKDLIALRTNCGIPKEVELILSVAGESLELDKSEFCCSYKIYFKECGLCFSIFEILTHLMCELGVALPQLCPNLIREVIGLQTLAMNYRLPLEVPSLARVCMIRKSFGCKENFNIVIEEEYRVLSDRPSKDQKWKNVFFSVNEFFFRSLTTLVNTDWSSSIAALPKTANTIEVDIFLDFLRLEDMSWPSSTQCRISESATRFRTYGLYDPNCQGYPSRKLRKMLLTYRKQRKTQMLLETATPPGVEPFHCGDFEVTRKSCVANPGKVLGAVPPSAANLVSALPAEVPSCRAAKSSHVRTVTSTALQSLGDRNTDQCSQLAKDGKKKALDIGSRSQMKILLPQLTYLGTSKTGMLTPSGERSHPEDRLLATFNKTVSAYQARLQAASTLTELIKANTIITSLKSKLESSHDVATKNAEALRLSDERLTRAKLLEHKLKDADVTPKAQLVEVEKKSKVLAETHELDLKVITREARKDLAIKFKATLDLVKLHLAGRDARHEPLIKVSETKVNIELLEIIIKGEFKDFQAELDVDKYVNDLVEAEVRVPKLNLSQMELLISNNSLEIATTSELVESTQPFDDSTLMQVHS
ncbi:unnamed protein product [Arabis nemorensis]|uniref:Uncharacterized protein n=1 Tax=Arabis nemorensis TaxID=586526 RepID=A0A565CCS2_9BRAS|nr:unnamed protein product [Arabis nemorensis]